MMLFSTTRIRRRRPPPLVVGWRILAPVLLLCCYGGIPFGGGDDQSYRIVSSTIVSAAATTATTTTTTTPRRILQQQQQQHQQQHSIIRDSTKPRRRIRRLESGPPVATTSGTTTANRDSNTSPATADNTYPNDGSYPSKGRTILTVLYICVLSLCFVTPIFYYCRLHFEERHLRRLRDMEVAGLRRAMQRSTSETAGGGSHRNREQSRAMRRKYIEERRARLLQLLGPVSVKLGPEHFPVLPQNTNNVGGGGRPPPDALPEQAVPTLSMSRSSSRHDIDIETGDETNDAAEDDRNGGVTRETAAGGSKVFAQSISFNIEDEEDETLMVRIPKPGLFLDGSNSNDDPDATAGGVGGSGTGSGPELRLAPANCTICLCNFNVGTEIVWSSNSECDHVFHQDCIERWLLRQRDGPLCPCCRRDFVIDPYDLQDVVVDAAAASPPPPPVDAERGGGTTTTGNDDGGATDRPGEDSAVIPAPMALVWDGYVDTDDELAIEQRGTRDDNPPNRHDPSG